MFSCTAFEVLIAAKMSLKRVIIEGELYLIHDFFVGVQFFNPYPKDISASFIREYTFFSLLGG